MGLRSALNRRVGVSVLFLIAATALLVFESALLAANYLRVQTRPSSGATSAVHRMQADLFASLGDEDRVVMLGDSLTALGAWDELLGQPVANRGINGDTSAGVLQRLGGVPRSAPAVLLMIGTNDLAAGVPADQVAANTRLIVRRLPGKVIVQSVVTRTDLPLSKQISRLNALNRSFCASGACQYLDVDAAIAPLMSGSLDGIHLSPSAYKAWARLLSPIVAQAATRQIRTPANLESPPPHCRL